MPIAHPCEGTSQGIDTNFFPIGLESMPWLVPCSLFSRHLLENDSQLLRL